ncbi:hypothetical protein C8Q74DRAFT_1294893 [Fomes fomentarius]|nr:hypothetical protein C8Q74DRAFT_1294893 [Fomes fomentarius]
MQDCFCTDSNPSVAWILDLLMAGPTWGLTWGLTWGRTWGRTILAWRSYPPTTRCDDSTCSVQTRIT